MNKYEAYLATKQHRMALTVPPGFVLIRDIETNEMFPGIQVHVGKVLWIGYESGWPTENRNDPVSVQAHEHFPGTPVWWITPGKPAERCNRIFEVIHE